MRTLRLVMSLVLSAALVVSCGGSQDQVMDAQASGGPTVDSGTDLVAPQTSTAGEALSGTVGEGATDQPFDDVAETLDDPDEAIAFWAATTAYSAALEAEYFDDFEEMAMSASAVILGRVVGKVTGPTIKDESEPIDSEFTLSGYEVEVVELVAGSLPVGGKTIQLATYLTPDDYSTQPALMFLRWKGQHYEDGWGKTTPEAIKAWDQAGYRLVSSQGLFVNALIGAWNPISSEHEGYLEEAPTVLADPVAQQVRHLSLDELVSLVKSLR